MIDPKTLKEGDVVVFGGNVELTVGYVSDRYAEWGGGTRFTYFDEPFWQIAELKKLDLPYSLNHYDLQDGGSYTESNPDFDNYTPSVILKWLKQDVEKLESAGVKETE